jgi:hypothetical protein
MSDDGRLELDDDGFVVDASSTSAPVVDLADPEATDRLDVSPLDSWVTRSVTPWVQLHRRAVVAVTTALAVTVLAGAWWTARPEPAPAPAALLVENAPTVGSDIGGPRIDPSGRLSVAYAVTADRSLQRVEILELVGPGLTPAGVENGDPVLASGVSGYVQLAAQVRCNDPALATASPGSYGLRLRSIGADGEATGTVQTFTSTTTALDIAVRDRCVTTDTPVSISVASVALSGSPGTSVVDAVLEVHNDSDVPTNVATERLTSTGVEVDQSPTILVPQHGSATVPTRLLVHDCSSAVSFAALSTLLNPVSSQGSFDSYTTRGIDLRIGIGDRTAVWSYPLPRRGPDLATELADLACTGRPTVSATLADVRGQAQPGGGWSVSGTLNLRTTGIGVTLGREHFTGPALGEGSSLATTDTVVPGVRWALAPTQLDGGAGRVPVAYSGSSCSDASADIPATIAVRVTMPDRSVYPFEVPLEQSPLHAAIDLACGSS